MRAQASALVVATALLLTTVGPAAGADAYLSFTPGALDNALLPDDDERCPVQGVYQATLHLTRVGQDLYQDQGGRGMLRTQFCYVYAYGEAALLPARPLASQERHGRGTSDANGIFIHLLDLR